MSRHGRFVCARQYVKRGVFERVIAPCFENKGEVENHNVIIPLTLALSPLCLRSARMGEGIHSAAMPTFSEKAGSCAFFWNALTSMRYNMNAAMSNINASMPNTTR